MKATITDPGLQVILEQQLRTAKISWLDIASHSDHVVCGYPFAIYNAALSSENGAMFDAWLVSGGGQDDFPYGGIYNRENYPDLEDALAAHIGKLVLSDQVQLAVADAPSS